MGCLVADCDIRSQVLCASVPGPGSVHIPLIAASVPQHPQLVEDVERSLLRIQLPANQKPFHQHLRAQHVAQEQDTDNCCTVFSKEIPGSCCTELLVQKHRCVDSTR